MEIQRKKVLSLTNSTKKELNKHNENKNIWERTSAENIHTLQTNLSLEFFKNGRSSSTITNNSQLYFSKNSLKNLSLKSIWYCKISIVGHMLETISFKNL